jgi:hypothetical protein
MIPSIATPPADLAQQANLVATYLEGTLSTARRAAANPKVAHVTMTTCRITVTPQPSANRIDSRELPYYRLQFLGSRRIRG